MAFLSKIADADCQNGWKNASMLLHLVTNRERLGKKEKRFEWSLDFRLDCFLTLN